VYPNSPLTIQQFFQSLNEKIANSFPDFVYLTGSVTRFQKQSSKRDFEYITFTLQDAATTNPISNKESNSIRCYWPSNNYNNSDDFNLQK